MSGSQYASISDESLVAFARNSDSAMAQLIARMAPTVKYAAARVKGFGSLEADDLAQEGMLGLMAAIETFDPQRGAAFSTYASACVTNRITTAVRRSLRSSEVPGEKLVSLENLAYTPTDDSTNPENIIIGIDEASRIMRILDENLSDFENSVLRLYLAGGNYAEISASLCVSEKAVDNALQRIRKKLKSFN